MSRYIYEHLFLAHLYFAEPTDGEPPPFFELVRSKTPQGEPIAIVATRRPFDDPGVPRVYYRLRPVLGAILDKTHMPYRIDEARMQRWRELFLAPDYVVTKLPAYDAETASNPFVVFHELPIHTRYAFMLDEAEFTFMGFIKGPVCRGQVALNVVDDHFWVFFLDPDLPEQRGMSEVLSQQASNLDLPAEEGSNVVRVLKYWRAFRKREQSFLEVKARFVQRHLVERRRIDERIIWDGAGSNANAALTVFRHFDSATVAKGLLGGSPKTAWVISYPLLERIHYLLVAGYDAYGNLGHQLLSRSTWTSCGWKASRTSFISCPPMCASARSRTGIAGHRRRRSTSSSCRSRSSRRIRRSTSRRTTRRASSSRSSRAVWLRRSSRPATARWRAPGPPRSSSGSVSKRRAGARCRSSRSAASWRCASPTDVPRASRCCSTAPVPTCRRSSTRRPRCCRTRTR